ncbi:hypothetical protein [Polyangium sp. 15x6]|uniref:hypothetical protein n=1 Tax=Polyangium sp. 15x6 TaxID=3042687 RepID=UPI00249C1262|nr:hypothetical protein [Polyangium sp. 15x6]MDI3284240.1 hypothetical protein [Polyangium sp. 15x6]
MPEWLLVVWFEAKTGSTEHETPTGEMQTFAYPKATVEALGGSVLCWGLPMERAAFVPTARIWLPS